MSVTELAKSRSGEMLAVLIAVARDASAPASARVSAATAVLDRGYGKPVATVHAKVRRSAADLSDDELLAIVLGVQDEPASLEDDDEISGLH